MPLTRIPVPVSDIKTIFEDFDFIEMWQAETKWGNYTQISTNATRIQLVEDQVYYEYDDDNGSEYYWYKWRFTTSNGPISEFYPPVQGYTPNTTYCGLEAVKTILKSKDNAGRIRFSDFYKNLRKKSNTQSINLKALSINPDYAGFEAYKITFTSVTEFKLEVGEESQMALREIGTGDINTDFISNDNTIRINKDDWIGAPVIDDVVEFETYSHMSINDAIKFIQDAEIFTDLIIEENIQYDEPKENELRFSRNTVPKAVKFASSRFAAFFIYSTIYNEQTISGLPGNINDITTGELRKNDISTWPKQAMRALEAYIKKYSDFFDPETGDILDSAPRWKAMDSFFDAGGVYGVGEGLKLPELNKFEDVAQMSYAGLLDYDLLMPFVNEQISDI